MTGTRDYQRSKVYAWENRVIAPRAPGVVSFAEAQGMVNAIWAEMGLKYPPAVMRLPKQARATVASATRLEIFLPKSVPSWLLLHEIAHSMTSAVDGRSDGHGSLFMGLYVRLLAQYLRFGMNNLLRSLEKAGVKFDGKAEPIFQFETDFHWNAANP